jgi:hypothetical protein
MGEWVNHWKKICGIKVVILNGSTPKLWESFRRYGGNGTGFATRLLGFLVEH